MIIAIISLFSGGAATILLKLLETFLGRKKEKLSYESDLRKELREELERKEDTISDLKKEFDNLQQEVARWRIDYWELFEAFYQLKILGISISDSRPDLKKQIDEIMIPHEKQFRRQNSETSKSD